MANWKLKLDIREEFKELQNFTQNMSDETELDDDFIALAKKFEEKFLSYESEIKRVTEDDGTFEDLERELEDFVMSFNIDNANYTLENIYQICDYAMIEVLK